MRNLSAIHRHVKEWPKAEAESRTGARFPTRNRSRNFPLWLAPDQVRVITLNDDAALIDYAKPIVHELRANMVRVDTDFTATPFKAKIADAEKTRVHTMLVIGGRDMEAGAVSVRLHHGGPQGAKPKAEVIADILANIKERRA